ncbi:MAG TPA: trypsin-like peptidase domain-containing protein [Candidatus Acidoferrales bacterium]|nr:trypsin-like peptidase domain-containing protein [Candidatus Acidoferrales bacterium]
MTWRRTLAGLGFGAILLAAGCAPSLQRAAATPSPARSSPVGAAVVPAGSGALQQFQEQLVQLVARVEPSVVEVVTSQGLGSGIVFDGAGNIVTNAHVVAGAGNLAVVTSTGQRYPATLVGTYPAGDVAVLHVNARGLPAATFADSSTVKRGDIVLAVGSPYGYSGSVTDGIVSATGRTADEGNGVTLSDLIQTSAGINPGNSGGALVGLDGKVVGMPTLGSVSAARRGQPGQGIGFAISSNRLVTVANQLIKQGKVTRTGVAYLGVSLANDAAGGARIVSVVGGSPAAQAGLQPQWVITMVGGQAVADVGELGQAMATHKPGDSVGVEVRLPDGSSRTLGVTLGELPA